MNDDEFPGAILYCPVCTTPVDVEQPGQQSFTCTSCSTEWSVLVVTSITAEHSMFG